MRYRHDAALALMAVVVVACGRGGPKIVLRFRPPTGAVYHYAIEQRAQVAIDSGPALLVAMGRRRMMSRMHFTQTVKGGASGGGTEMEIVFESMTLEIPGISTDAIARELAKLNGMRTTVVLDERGRITRSGLSPSSVPSDLAQQMEAGVHAMSLNFPEYPVGAGDSWTDSTELPLGQVPGADASAAGPAKATTTIREIRIAGADTSAVMDIKLEFPPGPITVRFGKEWGTIRLGGDITGHQQFSISRGAMLDGTVKGTTRMRVSSPSLGEHPITMSSETESSIFLLR